MAAIKNVVQSFFIGSLMLVSLWVSAQGTRLLWQPAISTNQIAFEYGGDIWLTPKTGGEAKRITSTAAVEGNPHFSPDGNWIGFFANDRLKKTSLDKREPTELCRASETTGACWTTNGKIIFAALDGTQLLSVDESGGASKIITLQDKITNNTITNSP